MKEIELDNTVLVACPEKSFNVRPVKFCLDCDHYKGMVRHTDTDDADIMKSHHVLCARPRTRALIKMSID